MPTPQPAFMRPSQGLGLQRACARGGTCADCTKDEDGKTGSRGTTLHRKAARPSQTMARAEANAIPGIVHEVLRSPGRPLDVATRELVEPRFGLDFSDVRLHTDAAAAESARSVNALAYTVGNHIAFDSGQYAPQSQRGQWLLAHELTHVGQQGGVQALHPKRIAEPDSPHESEADKMADFVTSPNVGDRQSPALTQTGAGTLQPYRKEGTFNHGALDTATMKEKDFLDPEGQPWIELIEVNFDEAISIDGKSIVPIGTAVVKYFNNAAAIKTFTVDVTGGQIREGLTHRGMHTVIRIEGAGYHHVPIEGPDGVGPQHKYSAKFDSSMHYAVFFHEGEALHVGELSTGSHGCVHMGDSEEEKSVMRQINYHSVIHHTKIHVTYSPHALHRLCCAMVKFKKATAKGELDNPCNEIDPENCHAAKKR